MSDNILKDAVEENNIMLVKKLLNKSNVNKRFFYNATLVILAARRDNIDMVKFLIKNGANVNLVSKAGGSTVSEAVLNNNIEMVKFLIKNGLSKKTINTKDEAEGMFPISIAINNGNTELAKLLIKHGAKLNPNEVYDYSLTENQNKNVKNQVMLPSRYYRCAREEDVDNTKNAPIYCSRVITEFEIGKKLGKGGFGVVYKGKGKINGKKVKLAIKIMTPRKKLAINDIYIETEYLYFMSEKGLGPKMYDAFFLHKGGKIYHYLIMQYYPLNVKQVLKDEKISVKEKKEAVKNMISIVKKQLKIGFQCSDIKPENFLYNNGKVKISDFGGNRCIVSNKNKDFIFYRNIYTLYSKTKDATKNENILELFYKYLKKDDKFLKSFFLFIKSDKYNVDFMNYTDVSKRNVESFTKDVREMKFGKNYRGLWVQKPKPVSKMKRNEIEKNLNEFVKAWERVTKKSQNMSKSRIEKEPLSVLRKRLNYYYSLKSKKIAEKML